MDPSAQVYRTNTRTVEAFLGEIGLHIGEHDLCDRFPHEAVTDGMVIQITRGVTFAYTMDGIANLRYAAVGTTVQQLQLMLQHEYGEAVIFLGENQREIENNDILIFFTWQSEFFSDDVIIPYTLLENRTAAVRSGMSHVRQEGIPGRMTLNTAVVRIGGSESQREVVGEYIIEEPVDKIIDIGHGSLGARTDVNAPDFHYVRKITMNASAYTAGYGCTGKHPCDPWYGITATGRRVQPGIVSVDPTVIPLGTYLYVEGYGFSIAADVGGAIKGYKIDLFHERIEDALAFGRRNLTVYILE
jgi:3D (Asp-Asp-Asp) domain-containing protein